MSSPPVPAPVAPNPPAEVTANAIPDTTSQMDNEVSQITESKLAEAFKSPDYGSGIQVKSLNFFVPVKIATFC